MRRAILLRHASAQQAQHDASRELTASGVEEAVRAGAKIAALGPDWTPTLALCSTALRASATLAGVLPTLRAPTRCEYDARLYLASTGDLLGALQRAPDAETCLLVVAHEPGISGLVRLLTRRAEPAAHARFARGMPPASFAALALEIARWADATPGRAQLAAFESP